MEYFSDEIYQLNNKKSPVSEGESVAFQLRFLITMAKCLYLTA